MFTRISGTISQLASAQTSGELVTRFNPRGMATNLHFFDIRPIKSEMAVTQSKFCPEQVRMVLEFANYLLANLYQPEEITILTIYSSQVISIKKLVTQKFSKLNKIVVSTVENYQGEENEIILLSLVGSHKNNSIGFLKVANRTCAGLTRAKQGKAGNSRSVFVRKFKTFD